jgi:hypothetical protein
MKTLAATACLLLAAVTGASISTSTPAIGQGAAQAGPVALAAHRAVYDLKLATARGKRGAMQAVRGRILYDFTGSACEGYALQFRQVSELDSGEGKIAVSDLRASSWEDGGAKRLRFHSQNYLDERLRDSVDGQAVREDSGVAVRLTKPAEKKFDLKSDLVFPTEHVKRIIAAARADKTLLELAVYDGSDNGERVYDTLTVIGRPIAPNQNRPDDATGGKPAFSALTRWPVTISYFDRAAKENAGEQTPVYAVGAELYENGVSRALTLDYGDFVLRGEMTSVELKDVKPCP